ncbi:uncharacterized protein LOC127289540 [Leptopilina boulardi]|uniref:uncharacterized protein LOC127289540 n=1 Tax=Leptopilina boulardi TaxID=63433 RepID=UPI0021F5A94E|nr:uncharacterized protein LOC127289540 [Leptopilina boulardi]
MVFTTTTAHQGWDLIQRYSSLNRLLRITALCFRFLAILKGTPQSTLRNPINTKDLDEVMIYWIKFSQASYFPAELKDLTRGVKFRKSHPFARLTAFIDAEGVLRVGGRLNYSDLEFESKHPAIHPKDCTFSQLIIDNAHRKLLQGGTQLTLSFIRRHFWILDGRRLVKSYILRCVKCARQRAVRAEQLMGQLPKERVNPSRPFCETGVDYAGPITLLTWKGRGAKTMKGWLCLFVCFSTSALHIEAVTDYSTEGFIAAFRRLTSRRGIPQTLFSDCGTNFQGANKALQDLFKKGTQEFKELAQQLSQDGTNWSFNPPSAPHMGGKWEAAVKSVKFHLRRTVNCFN